MSTKSENSEIAVLQTQMEEVLKGIDEIKTKLDTYATNARVIDLEKRIDRVDHKKTLQTGITGILSGILGAVLAILIESYFRSK